jgi:hypothetical protein
MTRQELALDRTETLRQGWDTLKACIGVFSDRVCEGEWHLDGSLYPHKDIPADQLSLPTGDTLRRWYFATLATAGWIVTPRGPDKQSPAGYYRVTPAQGYAWDSLVKMDPKEVA